jgi:hypothetical protein
VEVERLGIEHRAVPVEDHRWKLGMAAGMILDAGVVERLSMGREKAKMRLVKVANPTKYLWEWPGG